MVRRTILALALSSCVGVRGADCDQIIAKMRRCDPSAATASDTMLSVQCPGTQASCVGMPVDTPEQCSVFMGCLYGD